jgi:hypothetical protein
MLASTPKPYEPRDWIFPLVVSVIICVASLYAWTGIDRDALEHCRLIRTDAERLACFDQAAAPRSPAKGGLAPALHPSSGTGS